MVCDAHVPETGALRFTFIGLVWHRSGSSLSWEEMMEWLMKEAELVYFRI